jgi:hypothetical protein
VVKPGVYRHFKKGKMYLVLFTATMAEEPNDRLVIYVPLYDDGVSGPFARPESNFTKTINREGVEVPRFELVRET